MNLSVGIVGLPNAGKSTLFNALLKRQIAQVAEYPFTTIEPNTGVVEVPDERLEKLAEIVIARDPVGLHPRPTSSVASLPAGARRGSPAPATPRIIPSAVKFIDIAGLIRGAHHGEGLGNAFLAHIREVDAILHVVRFFDHIGTEPTLELPARGITHVMGSIHPLRDIEVVNEELRSAGIKKPTLYVVNLEEKLLANRVLIEKLKNELRFRMKIAETVFICAKMEAELGELSESEQKEYLKSVGVEKLGLDQVIGESYKLLDLITFFTIKGGKQVQAWPLKRGKTVLDAAGEVHTDFEKKFIRAQVIEYEKLIESGSYAAAKQKGWLRSEGRDYEMRDGDVVEFLISS